MSSVYTMAYGLLGNSSEIVIAAAFLFTIIAGCVFTYLFGFNANSSDNSQETPSSTNEEKKSKEKKISKKSTTTATTMVTNGNNLKKEETSKIVTKKASKLPATPSIEVVSTTLTTKSKKSSPGKLPKVETIAPTKASQVKASTQLPVNVIEASNGDDDGWITVVDKKQKKSPSITEIAPNVQATVITAAAAAAAVQSSKNSKKKENSNINANKQAQPEAKVVEIIQPVTEVVQEIPSNDDKEDDWIPANSKLSKKNSKTKTSTLAPTPSNKLEVIAPSETVSPVVNYAQVEVAKLTVPVKQDKQVAVASVNNSTAPLVDSPKTNNKKKSKKEAAKANEPPQVTTAAATVQAPSALPSVSPKATKIIPVEKIEKPAAPLTLPKNATREEVQAAMIQAIIEANTNSGSSNNSNNSDINNNTNAKNNKKVTGAPVVVATENAPSSTTSNKSKSNNLNMPNLKQTNLSESMILIEKDNQLLKSQTQSPSSSSKSKSSRTESNQSSSDSLQDVEGDVEGFITITNKKSKKPVRREN